MEEAEVICLMLFIRRCVYAVRVHVVTFARIRRAHWICTPCVELILLASWRIRVCHASSVRNAHMHILSLVSSVDMFDMFDCIC